MDPSVIFICNMIPVSTACVVKCCLSLDDNYEQPHAPMGWYFTGSSAVTILAAVLYLYLPSIYSIVFLVNGYCGFSFCTPPIMFGPCRYNTNLIPKLQLRIHSEVDLKCIVGRYTKLVIFQVDRCPRAVKLVEICVFDQLSWLYCW